MTTLVAQIPQWPNVSQVEVILSAWYRYPS